MPDTWMDQWLRSSNDPRWNEMMKQATPAQLGGGWLAPQAPAVGAPQLPYVPMGPPAPYVQQGPPAPYVPMGPPAPQQSPSDYRPIASYQPERDGSGSDFLKANGGQPQGDPRAFLQTILNGANQTQTPFTPNPGDGFTSGPSTTTNLWQTGTPMGVPMQAPGGMGMPGQGGGGTPGLSHDELTRMATQFLTTPQGSFYSPNNPEFQGRMAAQQAMDQMLNRQMQLQLGQMQMGAHHMDALDMQARDVEENERRRLLALPGVSEDQANAGAAKEKQRFISLNWRGWGAQQPNGGGPPAAGSPPSAGGPPSTKLLATILGSLQSPVTDPKTGAVTGPGPIDTEGMLDAFVANRKDMSPEAMKQIVESMGRIYPSPNAMIGELAPRLRDIMEQNELQSYGPYHLTSGLLGKGLQGPGVNVAPQTGLGRLFTTTPRMHAALTSPGDLQKERTRQAERASVLATILSLAANAPKDAAPATTGR